MRNLMFALLFATFLIPVAAHANANEWKEKDTNGDGVISKAEFDAYGAKKFEAMDANHDGKITKDEAKAYHESQPHKVWDKTKAKARALKNDVKNNSIPADNSTINKTE